MKISDAEFNKRLELYVREEYNKAPIKPNGMYGTMAFSKVKEREFREKLRAEGYDV